MTEVVTRPPRPEKAAVVEDIKRRLQTTASVLLTEYRGMKVDEMQVLRRKLRGTGAEYKVVKCTLARLAATGAGFDELVPLLQGPIAFVFVDDDAAPSAKVLLETSKEVEALVLRGGILGGKLIKEAATRELAILPSRGVLLSQVAGAFKAPIQKTASLLAAPLQNLANLVDALAKKLDEEGATAAVTTADRTNGVAPAAAPAPAEEASAEDADGEQAGDGDDAGTHGSEEIEETAETDETAGKGSD